MGFLFVLCGCADKDTSNTAAPTRSETARLERPATKQGTIALEGTEQPFTFELFDSSTASLPAAFTTYVPQDMIAEPANPGTGKAVRFVANFGGRRQDQAYLEVSFYPPATAESEARTLIEQTAPGGAPLKRGSGVSRQFTWSLVEHSISHQSKADGRMAGVAALGRHGDRLFQVIFHYPEEYGDGFIPRAYRILEEWRWGDTNQGL